MFQPALSGLFLPLKYQRPTLEPFLRLPRDKAIRARTVNPQRDGATEGASPLVSPGAA